ncbi:MAG: hypothetical protein AAF564_22280 [Bacteroidota bacterium]
MNRAQRYAFESTPEVQEDGGVTRNWRRRSTVYENYIAQRRHPNAPIYQRV